MLITKDKNYLIIGDNTQFLKHLNKGFRNCNIFDVIYLDPPYNTNNKQMSYDDSSDKLKWLASMQDRLSLSRYYLSESGVLFISIDDNMLYNLKIVCDKVYGEDNFVGTFITRQAQRSNSKYINTTHEYIIVYAKDKSKLKPFVISRMDIADDREMILEITNHVRDVFQTSGKEKANRLLKEKIDYYCDKRDITWLRNYSNIDDNGNVFFAKDLSVPGKPNEIKIEEIGVHLKPLKTRAWSSKEKIERLYEMGRICEKNGRPYEISYLTESCDSAPSVLNFYSRQGTKDLEKLGLKDCFDTPKPVALMKYLFKLVKQDNQPMKVLDMYGGSGTTAHAVYESNYENSNDEITYCIVQRREAITKQSKVYQYCIDNNIQPDILNITMKRITIVANKYEKEMPLIYDTSESKFIS